MKKTSLMALAGLWTLLALACFAPPAFAQVKVAMLPSWGGVPVISELNSNWPAYGTTPLRIDTSLLNASSFTYADLVATSANVLWVSDAAGGSKTYTADQVQAIQRYASTGHSLLGTYAVFQWGSTDNRSLAPLFGLSATTTFPTTVMVPASGSFSVLAPSNPLFARISNPYVSGGYPYAEVPATTQSWSPTDLAAVTLFAETPDDRGIITWYDAGHYHAIYVSEMVEYNGNAADTQFLYNALTVPEPATLALLALGGLALLRRRRAAKAGKRL